ncbi:hypothetical protein QQ045_000435 [Rhodiola kirilowii]
MSADAKAKKEREAILIACMAAASGTTLLVAAGRVVFWRRRKSKSKGEYLGHFRDRSVDDSQMEELELQEFDPKTLSLATNGFAEENKIGKGGFGNVYRGVLSSGQEIAVKRLAEDSKQGPAEFKNEVMLNRLSHRNLVRLVGWCSKGSEHMLVYDYMPNRSLDHFVYEIISGRKVWSYNQLEDDEISLLGHTWTAWSEASPIKIVDKGIEGSFDKTEVIRCIQVGLLCGQQYPEDRPTMSSVISMLSTSIDLTSPKLPGFVPGPSRAARDSDGHTICTINDVTITTLEER